MSSVLARGRRPLSLLTAAALALVGGAVVTQGTAAAADPKLPDVKAYDKALIDSLREVHNKGAELYNAFNHVNLGQPTATVDSPTAGKIFGLANLAYMRRWQLGIRMTF